MRTQSSYEYSEQVKRFLEGELAASAAGFPGAHDDITTYIRMEMASPELEKLILKENGIPPQNFGDPLDDNNTRYTPNRTRKY